MIYYQGKKPELRKPSILDGIYVLIGILILFGIVSKMEYNAEVAAKKFTEVQAATAQEAEADIKTPVREISPTK